MTLLDLEIGSKSPYYQSKRSWSIPEADHRDGVVKGQEVRAVQKAPMNDPIEYHIMGYNVSLRNILKQG
jgi:ferrous iron transport protein B